MSISSRVNPNHNAKIIAITQPLVGSESPIQLKEFVAYVARVSNPSNQNNHLSADKLLRYLAKHKHWSPFEMVNIVMEINTTRDIARQVLRHRSFSFQEFSQRYADPTKDLGFVTREARLQDTKNRQNSIVNDDKELETSWNEMQTYVRSSAEKLISGQSKTVLPRNKLERFFLKV